MARIHSPSDVDCHSASLFDFCRGSNGHVGNDIGFGIDHIKVANLVSGVGYKNDPLDVGNDISSRIEQVKVNHLVSDFGCNHDSLDVRDDINFRTEQNKVEGPIDLGEDNVPCTVHGTVSLERQQCRHMAAASASTCGDGSE